MLNTAFSKSLSRYPRRRLLKTIPSFLINEIEYLFYFHKYKKTFLKFHNIKSLLVIIDIYTSSKDIFYQCSKVLRFYFPDARIDFICNYIDKCDLNFPPIHFHDNLFSLSYGKGIATVEDNEITGKIISGTAYSVILNLSPYFEKEAFEKNQKFISLYELYHAYLKNPGSSKSPDFSNQSSLNSFLHHYFSSIPAEAGHQVHHKQKFLLRTNN